MLRDSIKKAVTLIILFILPIMLTSCTNTGMRFFDTIYDTFCCFSPAMILPAVFVFLYTSRRS
ncbi:MAG: hypothetical protein R6U57_00550 [Anaerolineales bacterium]